MPYICMRRDDIPSGVLQVKDLWPNISQRNSVVDPVGQGPRYARYPDDDSVALRSSGDARYTVSAASGLTAYILARVATSGGAALSAANAIAIAEGILDEMEDGNPLELADVNTEIDTVSSGATLTGGDSTGALAEVLQILAGAEFVLPAGSEVQNSSGNFVGTAGAFTTGTYRTLTDTDSLRISFYQGDIAGFRDSSFTYGGDTGAALVVYANDGTLYA